MNATQTRQTRPQEALNVSLRLPAPVVLALLFVAALARPALAHNPFPTTPETQDGHYIDGAYPAADAAPRWYYESRFPGKKDTASSYKDAVRRGALEWYQAGATFRFVSSGYREQPYFADPYYSPDPVVEDIHDDAGPRSRYCDATAHDDPDTPQFESGTMSLVFWSELPPETLGEATTCNRVPTGGGPARPFKFFVAFNRLYATCAEVTNPADGCRGNQWYRKADPNVGPRRFDLQSVATHEFGHATGFYWHFDDPGMNSGTGHTCGLNSSNRETMCAVTDRGSSVTRSLEAHDLHTFRTDATQAGAYPAR